ncbi:hyaluronidase-1 isoform X2 [Denticeps clupeoides]|uniref:Hyaluronidase n=1 Tax=Denticeps clupeoides TaxID=299321 RepID=A0AAY4ASX3_9TELE|nr:hyaluronidase-1-like isoform X2 [Denticeps clupeoides]
MTGMGHFLAAPPLLLLVFSACSSPFRWDDAAFPSASDFPFLAAWNAPTNLCKSRYGVDLDLSMFDIVVNDNQTFAGDNVTIFYESHLGLYPYYTSQGVAINGGVPQNASLQKHLWAAEKDLSYYIPDALFQGLAVIDWESWRPLWDRNWDSKHVYWQGSEALVRAQHPDWNPQKVLKEARARFEQAGRAFMEETLRLALAKRPGGMWGFYGFPDCYNNPGKTSVNYTGACPELEVRRNDQLRWLWNASSALYPQIYLDLSLRGRQQDVLLYTRHRVQEAMRVREQVTATPPAVLPYARIVYTFTLEFLSEEELINTIGESAALGAAGVVLWGDANYAMSKASCEAVKDYVDKTLGPYVVNVTTAAQVCSRNMCSSHGRCQRKDASSGAHLHLDPAAWTISPRAERPGATPSDPLFVAQEKPGPFKDSAADLLSYKCQCFAGWSGTDCSVRLKA